MKADATAWVVVAGAILAGAVLFVLGVIVGRASNR